MPGERSGGGVSRSTSRGSVVLSHGAGGGIDAADLVALRKLVDDGWTYVRVEQPWRVAGKKIATPPKTLDAAWIPILANLMTGRWALPRPLVVGGRSAGARVACRTATGVGADAVLALSFPLHPPNNPDRSRAFEAQLVLDAGLPLAVIQGERDPFGGPADVREALGPQPSITGVPGDHSLARGRDQVLAAARAWLATLAPPRVHEQH
ncbi:alpha/beta family hydrolase [Flexivirga alba]|uniref:Alpha/beta family hydrolase n=1 Tax=Flexivirga alba TaxID=702742 RepID=A0ABW2AGG8_9MICO